MVLAGVLTSSIECTPGIGDTPRGFFDEVGNHATDHAAHGFVNRPAHGQRWVALNHGVVLLGEQAHLTELFDCDEFRAQAVVDVVVVVGDFIGDVGQLGLETRLALLDKTPSELAEFGGLLGAQCLRMPSRVSKVRLSPGNSA